MQSKKEKIREMREIARARGGKCISDKYVNCETKLKWQCGKGHIWWAISPSIKGGSWCPYCYGNVKHTIEEVQQIAKSRGGKCLSVEYFGANIKLKWQCLEGHIWKSTPAHIKNRNHWCPICAKVEFISERICRGYFETIFNMKFPKSHPKWLKNSKGRLLELDGYNKKLKLAFEYNGIQHYSYTKYFHKRRTLKETKQNDELKRKLCKQNRITLIDVPYSICYEKMGNYIIKQCGKKDVEIPTQTKLNSFDYKSFDVYSINRLKEMQEIAKSRSGKCLSNMYVDNKTKLRWQCSEGHIWEATPSHIKSGEWCSICAHKRIADKQSKSIEEMQKLAENKGGNCLSKRYINAHVKLRWECKKRHIWGAIPNNIQQGKWCPVCGHKESADKQRGSIVQMQELAKKRNGKCLSLDYTNNHTKLKWECVKGYIWEAISISIKRGTWCPFCARKHT